MKSVWCLGISRREESLIFSVFLDSILDGRACISCFWSLRSMKVNAGSYSAMMIGSGTAVKDQSTLGLFWNAKLNQGAVWWV